MRMSSRAFILAVLVALSALGQYLVIDSAHATSGLEPSFGSPQLEHQDLSDEPEGYEVPVILPFAFGGATGSQEGCQDRRNVVNHSFRSGVVPRILVAHYTVSPNVDGWGDVNAIVNYFNRAEIDASSTYIIDFEGNCAYIVDEDLKPWTQGFFNPWSISIEFIATGSESKKEWKTKGRAGLKKAAKVFADASLRWNIPIRIVNPEGCGTPPKGLTDHDRLECGNFHTDVKPAFPMRLFKQMIEDELKPPQVRFHLKDGEGERLVSSRWAERGNGRGEARFESFMSWITEHRAAWKALQADGDFKVTKEVTK